MPAARAMPPRTSQSLLGFDSMGIPGMSEALSADIPIGKQRRSPLPDLDRGSQGLELRDAELARRWATSASVPGSGLHARRQNAHREAPQELQGLPQGAVGRQGVLAVGRGLREVASGFLRPPGL